MLALGTAQWGLHYGIANRSGRPGPDTVAEMLHEAAEVGIDTIDTARAYGQSEELIGAALTPAIRESMRIVTKLDPDVCREEDDVGDVLRRASASVEASLDALATSTVDVLLLHRAGHRHCAGGALWEWLRDEVRGVSAHRLGVSAATPAEALRHVDDPEVEVIQVASSVLDQRLLQEGFFERAATAGTEVHVRSVYLQGLAHLGADGLPAHLLAARPALAVIDRYARTLGLPAPDLWLLFARTLRADRLVIGVENPQQIRSNSSLFRRAIPDAVRDLRTAIEDLPDEVLDPSLWSV